MCQEIKPVSDKQMEALKTFISQHEKGTVFGKKALLWTLEQTENLSKPITLRVAPESNSGRQIVMAVHDMRGSRNEITLDEFMEKMDTPMRIRCSTYTIWIPSDEKQIPDTVFFVVPPKEEITMSVTTEEIQKIALLN